MRKYVESVLRRKASIPNKSYIHKKHVESILGTFLTHENKIIQFEYYDLWQCTFSWPLVCIFWVCSTPAASKICINVDFKTFRFVNLVNNTTFWIINKILSSPHDCKFVGLHPINWDLCSLMNCHLYLRTNTIGKIAKHPKCTLILPSVSLCYSVKVLIKPWLDNRRFCTFCFALFQREKVNDAPNKKRLTYSNVVESMS